ncbi:MAG: acyl carrier protein [Terricaulis sp.]
MNRDALYAEIADYLTTAFEVAPALITPDADLAQKLNLDSIDAVDLMVKLQEITGRKISPTEFESVRTINDVLNIAQKIHDEN